MRFEDARMIAEIRLYSITLSLQNNSQRIQNCEGDYEEITNWKKDCAHLFSKFNPKKKKKITSFCN